MQRPVFLRRSDRPDWRLGHQNVGIRSAKSKCAYARHPAVASGKPRRGLSRDLKGKSQRGDVRVEFLQMKMRRNFRAPQCENDFNQSGNPGRGLEVADVRLDRSDVEAAMTVAG